METSSSFNKNEATKTESVEVVTLLKPRRELNGNLKVVIKSSGN